MRTKDIPKAELILFLIGDVGKWRALWVKETIGAGRDEHEGALASAFSVSGGLSSITRAVARKIPVAKPLILLPELPSMLILCSQLSIWSSTKPKKLYIGI